MTRAERRTRYFSGAHWDVNVWPRQGISVVTLCAHVNKIENSDAKCPNFMLKSIPIDDLIIALFPVVAAHWLRVQFGRVFAEHPFWCEEVATMLYAKLLQELDPM